jgi:integrase
VDANKRLLRTKSPGIFRDRVSGRYSVRIRDKRGRQVSQRFDTLADAKAWQARQRVTPSDSPAPVRITFREYVDTYIARHPEWTPSTRSTAEYRRNSVCAALGDLRLDRIVAGDVAEHLAVRKAAGIADSTIAAERNFIASVFRAAFADRLVTWIPTDSVKAPKVRKHAAARAALLTPDQVSALLTALPERWRTFGEVIALTGLRGGEAAGLTADRVDLMHGTLTVDRQLVTASSKAPVFGPPKTASSARVLPLGDTVAALLRKHLDSTPLGVEGLLFTTRTGRPMTRSVRSEVFRDAAAGLDLPDAARGWHALRHTYGSLLLAQGVDVVTVSAWLGHNGPAETLSTYAHVDPANLTASADVAAIALGRSVL